MSSYWPYLCIGYYDPLRKFNTLGNISWKYIVRPIVVITIELWREGPAHVCYCVFCVLFPWQKRHGFVQSYGSVCLCVRVCFDLAWESLRPSNSGQLFFVHILRIVFFMQKPNLAMQLLWDIVCKWMYLHEIHANHQIPDHCVCVPRIWHG